MALFQLKLLTEAEVATAVPDSVAPYTYVALHTGPSASSAVPNTITCPNNWTIAHAQVGADYEVTVDSTANPNDNLIPIYTLFKTCVLEFTDVNSDTFYLRINKKVKGVVPVIPPVGVDDTVTAIAGQTVNVDVIVNDTDANGTVVDANAISGVPAGWTVVEGAVDGTVDITPPVGTAPGTYTFTYEPVDNDGLSGNTTTVTVTVPDVYARIRVIGGSTLAWRISSQETPGSVTLYRESDGTALEIDTVGDAFMNTFVVPAADDGEWYSITDPNLIVTPWGFGGFDAGNTSGISEIEIVNDQVNSMFLNGTGTGDNVTRLHLQPQLYPNFTLINWVGADPEIVDFQGTYGNSSIDFSIQDFENIDYLHLPTDADMVGSGNVTTLDIQDLNVAGATYVNYRTNGPTDATDPTNLTIPAFANLNTINFNGSDLTQVIMAADAFYTTGTTFNMAGSNLIVGDGVTVTPAGSVADHFDGFANVARGNRSGAGGQIYSMTASSQATTFPADFDANILADADTLAGSVFPAAPVDWWSAGNPFPSDFRQ